MNLKGKRITHKTFGDGKIVSVVDNTVQVAFKTSIKSFLYPDSFAKFMVLEDSPAQNYVNTALNKQTLDRRELRSQQKRRLQADAYAKKMRKKTNSQAVFTLRDKSAEDIFQEGGIFSGSNLSGKAKGEARIPKNMNINSACLLTSKADSDSEQERTINGIFMVREDFIGVHCTDGMLPIHQKYFLNWNEEHEKLLFWNYFPEGSRLERWGSSEMKYISITVMQQILEDMVHMSQGDDSYDKVVEFYRYFCEMNV